MLETITEKWDMIVGCIAFTLWCGRTTADVAELKKRPESVTIVACGQNQESCQKFQESQLAHGNKEFDRIHIELLKLSTSVTEESKTNQQRHERLLEIIMELRK